MNVDVYIYFVRLELCSKELYVSCLIYIIR